mmetsp:Transcript_5769/g.17137  ORF Transcript_5769/g.17137 Transcript_5769/m.17137 type:complete len:204 (+) Transcript_5769:1728-2339(+)
MNHDLIQMQHSFFVQLQLQVQLLVFVNFPNIVLLLLHYFLVHHSIHFYSLHDHDHEETIHYSWNEMYLKNYIIWMQSVPNKYHPTPNQDHINVNLCLYWYHCSHEYNIHHHIDPNMLYHILMDAIMDQDRMLVPNRIQLFVIDCCCRCCKYRHHYHYHYENEYHGGLSQDMVVIACFVALTMMHDDRMVVDHRHRLRRHHSMR